MMKELALNILDIAENSTHAESKNIYIGIRAKTSENRLYIVIKDDGKGMSEEKLKEVTDPFFTSRTTRKVGLGIPFFKMSAELTGGTFSISSEEGKGTETEAVYVLDSIDRMPLGDIAMTMVSLIGEDEGIDYVLEIFCDEDEFRMDTREFREILGDLPLDSPEVLSFIGDYINSNMTESMKSI